MCCSEIFLGTIMMGYLFRKLFRQIKWQKSTSQKPIWDAHIKERDDSLSLYWTGYSRVVICQSLKGWSYVNKLKRVQQTEFVMKCATCEWECSSQRGFQMVVWKVGHQMMVYMLTCLCGYRHPWLKENVTLSFWLLSHEDLWESTEWKVDWRQQNVNVSMLYGYTETDRKTQRDYIQGVQWGSVRCEWPDENQCGNNDVNRI